MMEAEIISSPFFWSVFAMVAFTAIQAMGALWARDDFAALGALAHEINKSDTFTAEEKREIALMLGYAVHWSTPTGLFVVTPFVAAFVMVKLITALARGPRITADSLGTVIPEASAVHKRVGNTVFKANPILAVWAALWLLPALCIAILTIGSLRFLPEIVERAFALAFERQSAHH